MRSSVDPQADKGELSVARPGTVWLCGACGKTFDDRNGDIDTSCRTWAVLVLVDSIMRDEAGHVVTAEAVNDPVAEIGW